MRIKVNIDFSKRLIYRYNTFSVGVENFINQFGFGATLNYNRLRIVSKVEGDGRNELLQTNQYSGTIFIGIYTEHFNGISFGLRPFVQLPLSQLDISGLDSDLGEPSGTTTKEKDFLLFGISLLIFNGY